MRILNIILCLLMLLFIAVQYNDPDGPLWMLIYLIPAIWAAIGGIRPALLKQSNTKTVLLLSIAAAFAGTVYFWPEMQGWWQKDIWIQELTGETAREGMGMMIVTVVLLLVFLSSRGKSAKDAV